MKIKTLILCCSLSLSSLLNGMFGNLDECLEEANQAFSLLEVNMEKSSIENAIKVLEKTLNSFNEKISAKNVIIDSEEEDEIYLWIEILENNLYLIQKIKMFLDGNENGSLLKQLASSSSVFYPIIRKAFEAKGVQF